MEQQARRLSGYVEERLGEALRAVGYHTPEDHEVVFIRDDVAADYPPERVERFIEASRGINEHLGSLDDMGQPQASLHELEDGFVIQFHRGGGKVVFLAVDHDVGRQLSRFLDDCLDQLG